jgi:TPR repeat protein
MAVLIRTWTFTAAALLLAACGAPVDGPEADAAAEAAAALDPKAAAEAAKEKAETDKLAEQKPPFDAALAANDADALDSLADGGNAWALHHRAKQRIESHDYMLQQGGFEDMEAAADLGHAEALVWVGQRKAYGKDGYKLQPNSGLMMMERAARRGNIEAMLAVAVMYGQDAYMHDAKKARDWYKRAAEAGSAEAKSVLSQLDGEPQPESVTPVEP